MATIQQQSRLRATQSRRRNRVRSRVAGTAVRPRLVVFRSSLHISAQLIDDERGTTLVAAADRELKGKERGVERAALVGALLGTKAVEKNIIKVVFDRRGYKYHGQVRALADAARKAGLQF